MSDPDYRPLDYDGYPMDKRLVDDLADVLAGTVVGWKATTGIDLAETPEVQRVMARYRAEKFTSGTARPRFYSLRQRVIVLTFDTAEEAAEWDKTEEGLE